MTQAQPIALPTPRIVPRDAHGISRKDISPNALRVLYRLREGGFQGYLVGGAVRDLLIGGHPKDFDVATDATPEQVKSLFRNCRLIGRRFRLAHVVYGREIIEVATFRANSDDGSGDREVVDDGRLLRDNVYGSIEDDAVRRDFTANALYYTIEDFSVRDFVGGYEDVQARVLRLIGDPEQRYREDPVRMLRAVRLGSKLDMQIDAETAKPIGDLAPLLQNVPPSRLFDEMLKLLLSGHSLSCVVELRARGLHHGLLPMLDVILEQPLGERFITIALKNTDERIRQNKPVSPGFLFAILLWHEVLANWNTLKASGEKPMPALFKAMDQILARQHKNLAIPRRFDAVIQEIWSMQPRFEARSGRQPFRLLAHPRFRAAYDFMQLRCESGELGAELGEWWKTFLSVDSEEREKMLPKQTSGKKPRKRRSRKKSSSSSAAPPGSATDQENS